MTSMTSYSRGDVVLSYVPFPDGHRDSQGRVGKKRPVVILSNGIPNALAGSYIVAAITSYKGAVPREDDVQVFGLEVRQSGLLADSMIRTTYIHSVASNRIDKRIGRLPSGLLSKMMQKVYSYLDCERGV